MHRIKINESFTFLFLFLVSQLVIQTAQASTEFVANLMHPTIYFQPVIDLDKLSCSQSDMKNMKSPSGNILVQLCENDFDRCLMQGSCFVISEGKRKSFNYNSRGMDGTARFIEVDLKRCPYGYGARSTCLDPYFTVAADLSIYNVGSVVYVPRAVGVRLPSGDIHDGFFVIRDSGAQIKGTGRFDFFTGLHSHNESQNAFKQIGFDEKRNGFEYRMATSEEAETIRQKRGFPGTKQSLMADFFEP